MKKFSKNNNSSRMTTMQRMTRTTAQRITTYSDTDLTKIRERAYFIWEGKNRPTNSSVEDWLEAEKQLKKLMSI